MSHYPPVDGDYYGGLTEDSALIVGEFDYLRLHS